MEELKIVNLENLGIREKRLRAKFESFKDYRVRFLQVGSFQESQRVMDKISGRVFSGLEIIFSAIPISKNHEDLQKWNDLFWYDNLAVHFPTNIVAPCLVSTELVHLHFSLCPGCECSLFEITEGYLSKGFRQIFVSTFAIDSYKLDQGRILDNMVLKSYIQILDILETGIEVWVDGEMLSPDNTGTNNGALELITEISKSNLVSQCVVISPEMNDARRAQLDSRALRYCDSRSLESRRNYNSILFRPNQSWRTSWLNPKWDYFDAHAHWWLDFISFDIPIYGGSWKGWLEIRNAAFKAFQNYEITFFLSAATANKYASHSKSPINLVEILPCSVKQPIKVIGSKNKRQLVVLGNAMQHKGRVFSLKLLEELLRLDNRYRLVIAGPTPPFASSENEEAIFLNDNPNLRAHLEFKGKLSNHEVETLIAESEAVLCPSVLEGFGLVPFEAALLGTVPFVSKIDFWAENISAHSWIDFYNLKKTAEEINSILNSQQKKKEQLDAFAKYVQQNSWQKSASIAIIGFAKALLATNGERQKTKESVESRIRVFFARSILARRIYRTLKGNRNAL